jgi:hypothetical protein
MTDTYNPLSRKGWDNHKKPSANGKMFGRLAEVVVGLAATMPFVVVLVVLVTTLLTLWP